MPPTIEVADGRVCSRCGRAVGRDETGQWRCVPCRSDERTRQRRTARNRNNAQQELRNLRHTAENGAELDETDLRRLVQADGPQAVDCDDDYALSARIGALHVTTADLVEADHLWATGQARHILKRAGVSAAQFARMTGASGRMVGHWLAGTNLPKATKHRHTVAAALLDLKVGNDDENAALIAHPTRTQPRRSQTVLPPRTIRPRGALQRLPRLQTPPPNQPPTLRLSRHTSDTDKHTYPRPGG